MRTEQSAIVVSSRLVMKDAGKSFLACTEDAEKILPACTENSGKILSACTGGFREDPPGLC